MLKAPRFTELYTPLFSSPEPTTNDEYSDLEVIVQAFQGVLLDDQLRHNIYNQQIALGFIRNYAVTQAGLGTCETRLTYFEAQRRARGTLLFAQAMMRDQLEEYPLADHLESV